MKGECPVRTPPHLDKIKGMRWDIFGQLPYIAETTTQNECTKAIKLYPYQKKTVTVLVL